MRRTQPYDPLVEAIESIMEAKRKRQYEQQISQVSPMLSRGGDRTTNIRDALAAIQAEQGPTGLGGVLDRLNPFAPARGRGSELEQDLLSEQMGQEKQRQGRLAKVGDKWGFISGTGEFQPIPTPPPSAVKLLEEYAKGTKAAAGIEEAGTVIPPEVLDAILGPMEKGLLERGGYEETEIPGEKRKRFGIDWLARDIPPRKEIRKKTPITEALTETKQKVKMPPSAKEERHLVRRKKVKAKGRPPKPKEYPDAVWNEEHQMWTIVKNGRLMGVK